MMPIKVEESSSFASDLNNGAGPAVSSLDALAMQPKFSHPSSGSHQSGNSENCPARPSRQNESLHLQMVPSSQDKTLHSSTEFEDQLKLTVGGNHEQQIVHNDHPVLANSCTDRPTWPPLTRNKCLNGRSVNSTVSMRKGRSKISRGLRCLAALGYRNALHKWRSPFSSLLEFLVPVAVVIAIWFLRRGTKVVCFLGAQNT